MLLAVPCTLGSHELGTMCCVVTINIYSAGSRLPACEQIQALQLAGFMTLNKSPNPLYIHFLGSSTEIVIVPISEDYWEG